MKLSYIHHMKAGAIAVRINRKFYILNRPCVRSGDFHFAKKSRIVGRPELLEGIGVGHTQKN